MDWQRAEEEFALLFPEEECTMFRFGFDVNTDLPKINIYRASGKFVGAFVLTANEIKDLVRWVSGFHYPSLGVNNDQEDQTSVG